MMVLSVSDSDILSQPGRQTDDIFISIPYPITVLKETDKKCGL